MCNFPCATFVHGNNCKLPQDTFYSCIFVIFWFFKIQNRSFDYGLLLRRSASLIFLTIHSFNFVCMLQVFMLWFLYFVEKCQLRVFFYISQMYFVFFFFFFRTGYFNLWRSEGIIYFSFLHFTTVFLFCGVFFFLCCCYGCL